MIAPIRNTQHILTIGLEDYFQVGAFNQFVQHEQWYRFEPRLHANTDRVLALLDEHNARATFFVLGWIARRFPEVVRRVADAGHEIATKGYYHRSINQMSPAEFEQDCIRARAITEDVAQQKVIGYRVANGWLTRDTLWALDILAQLGFEYDSSMAAMRGFADQPSRRFLHAHTSPDGATIQEVPISTGSILGLQLPILGGNYFRQLPQFLTRRAAQKWTRKHISPLVAYFHVWEIDPDQPRLALGGPLTRLRHYRNLHQMDGRLRGMLTSYRFTSIAESLQLNTKLPAGSRFDSFVDDASASMGSRISFPDQPYKPLTPVSIVVPCYNEESGIDFLSNVLNHVRDHLKVAGYEARFVIVDDGSRDDTWNRLQAKFQKQAGFQLQHLEMNHGVSGAIMVGIRASNTEIVASMDCDCSYDPLELIAMIPLLQQGVEIVTASPYHPNGEVRHVPSWRLFLSKGAAWMYRRVLKQKLHTVTSCFRVYRRSHVAGIQLTHTRYLGIAELAGRIDLAGGTIVEHPATLEIRVLGRSKMKTVRTIVGHLGLLLRLAAIRWIPWSRNAERNSVIRSVIESHRSNNSYAIRPQPKVDTKPFDVRKVVLHRDQPIPD